MSTAIKIELVDGRDETKKAMYYANRAATRKAGRIIAKEARANAPVASGATKKSIAVKTWSPKHTGRIANGEKRGWTRSDVGYWSEKTLEEKGRPTSFAKASWVENGTRPHEIKVGKKGNKKRVLSNGVTPFGRKFWQPGTKPKKPLQNAAKSKASEVGACAKEYYAKLTEIYKKPEGFFSEVAAAAGGDGDVEDGD